jgi:DNA-binding transcriptional ArsR family regulator
MVHSAVADDVFYALSNSTRRKVPSFVQHLSVLEQSRLVKSKKRGRVRSYEIVPERFKVAEDWLSKQRQLWEARLDRFDKYVKQLKETESKS